MILIKELLPNPSGDDTQNEWIRLINVGDTETSLDGLSLVDDGGKVFSLNSVGTLSAGETIELSRPTTGITLNNDGDTISIRNLEGDTLDQLSYSSNIGEDEMVIAERFIAKPMARENMEASALNLGKIEYQTGITPLLIGVAIALASSMLIWFIAHKHETDSRN